MQRAVHFTVQELANTAWAFAMAGQKNALLFEALATVAEQHMDHFNAQEIANTAWAFAMPLSIACRHGGERCMRTQVRLGIFFFRLPFRLQAPDYVLILGRLREPVDAIG